MKTLLEITLPEVKTMPVADLQKMIEATEDFDKVTGNAGVPLLTEDDVRKAARKYIREKLELGDETEQEAKEADPKFIAPEPGFKHVNVQEAANPQEAMIKAGFQNKDEMLKLLEALRRDGVMLDIRRGELDRREEGIREKEAVLSGKEASLEKKAAEVGKKYAEYQDLFARVQEARAKGIIT